MYKLDLEKVEEPEIKFPKYAGSYKKQENSKKTYTSPSLTTLKYITCLLRSLYEDQETTESGMEQWNGSKLGKEYDKAVYCHPVYLTSMQSTSCKLLGWMKHKLEKDCQENINNLRYADDTTLMAESEEEQKSLLMKMKEESEKTGLKLSIQKWYSPIVSLQIDGETVIDFLFLGSKITADGDFSKWN